MERGKRKNLDVWEEWSYSRANDVYNCPFLFYLLYCIPFLKLPVHISTGIGTIVHYWSDRFFTVPFIYKTPESFARAVVGFYHGVVIGKHGPDGFGTKPVIIDYDNQDPGPYYGWLYKVMEEFYRLNIDCRRGLSPLPMTEVEFKEVRLNGICLNGYIDRIDLPHVGEYCIVDYKRTSLSPWRARHSKQMTTYQLFGERLMGCPPRKMLVQCYSQGWQVQEIPLREPTAYVELGEWYLGAALYVKAVLTQRFPPKEFLPFIADFNWEDIERGSFSPKLPRGFQCTYCGGKEICRMTYGGLLPQGSVPLGMIESQLVGRGVERQLDLFEA